MLYLVCRADQLPAYLESGRVAEFKPSIQYYPRIVRAYSPDAAIEYAFAPDEYRPAGERKLVVIELGEMFQFTAKPRREYTLENTRPAVTLLQNKEPE